VSVASDGTQANGDSGYPGVSADGSAIVYGSSASNLVPGDTNDDRDVFVFDVATGTTTRVSVASDGTQANDYSYPSAVSADGFTIVYGSAASNLVPGDTNGATDAFIYNVVTGTTTRVSVASDGTQANDHSYPSAVSADGSTIVYWSSASNLVPGDTNGTDDVFVTRVDWSSGSVGVFIDDDGSVFESDIEWLAAEGITKGCNPPMNDMFCPDASVTRGQMAAFLTRALGLTERLDDPFIDDDDSIFEPDIERLAAAGITKGCNPPTNDRFCPNSKVTRQQMAAYLVRALGYADDGGGDLFVDDDESIFERDIDRLATAGVTKGCNPPTNDRFCPTNFVTRGQMAAFLHRALG
ncbi:MAG: hypothetical protein GY722_25890, partial [bacterium]|nr:hypothetical protein [bacterium]